jgi:DNA segregation ATPase FtsK/SpoIIIE, S-DNA-T family
VASAAEAGFPPLVAAFDEVHRLFQHRDKEIREEAARLAEDVIKQARKYGLIAILVTQSPTATSIPRPVTREVICRVAFSVIDQVGNDALLGDGSYRNGVRATELRPGSKHSPGDRGRR